MYPTQERLRELFDYDPTTGILTRKYANSRRPLGSPVGVRDGTGYLRMRNPACKASIGVHRIIWVWVHGTIPDGLEIDHINRIRDDNRLLNLRAVTHRENMLNNSLRIDNRTGVSGVQWDKNLQKWNARLRALQSNIYLGTFATKAEAIAARRAAEIVHLHHTKMQPPFRAAA